MKKLLLSVFSMLAFVAFIHAQQTLFSYSNSTLDAAQQAKLAQIQSEGFESTSIITIAALSDAISETGKIAVSLSGDECPFAEFTGETSQYTDDQNYFWYGKLIPQSECNCERGDLSLTMVDGELNGGLNIDGRSYIINDLGDDKQVLSKVSASHSGACANPVEVPDGFQTEGPLLASERNGTNCDIRILILGTQQAFASINGPNAFFTAGVNLANQYFNNSRIFGTKLVIAGIESTQGYFAENNLEMFDALVTYLRIHL